MVCASLGCWRFFQTLPPLPRPLRAQKDGEVGISRRRSCSGLPLDSMAVPYATNLRHSDSEHGVHAAHSSPHQAFATHLSRTLCTFLFRRRRSAFSSTSLVTTESKNTVCTCVSNASSALSQAFTALCKSVRVASIAEGGSGGVSA